MQILKGHLSTKPVRSLAFSPDGTKLASSARDYKTFLWDLASGTYEVIEDHASHTVAFSPDGNTVATGRGSDVVLWDVTARTRRVQTPLGGYWYAPRLAFSPDGKRLAGAGSLVCVWDVADPTKSTEPPRSERANRCLAFSRDGATLATSHSRPDHVVRLWDTKTWQLRKQLRGSTGVVEPLAFSPDGRHLAGCAASALLVWDVASGDIAFRQTISKQHYKDVAFTPDGRHLAFARNDATVSFLNTSGWAEAAAYDFQIGPMICLAIAPDGMRAAGGSGKGKIVVFDIDL